MRAEEQLVSENEMAPTERENALHGKRGVRRAPCQMRAISRGDVRGL